MDFNVAPIEQGDIFESWKNIEDFMSIVTDFTGELYTTERSNKLHPKDFQKSGLSEVEINKIIEKLVYNRKTLKCKYGASTATKKKEDKPKERNTSTFNRGCPAFIKFHKVFKNGEYVLEAYATNFDHENHPPNSKIAVNALPERRRLPPCVKQKVMKLIKLGCKNRLIRLKINKEYNIQVLSKDISNIKQAMKNPNGNNLGVLQELLEKEYGCTTRVKADADFKFEALYFTNKKMQKSFSQWPEILFVDGTYKLFNLRFILYLFVVQNGFGRSEICGAAIAASEKAEVLEWIARNFRDTNSEASEKTLCIMTDKDMTERKAFAAVFPYVKFLLCLYHTLKTFDKELKKMQLDFDTRRQCFELLRKLAYAKSEEEYDKLYVRFIEVAPKNLLHYYNVNWHMNREEWTLYGMAEVNYGNTTNNLVESTNNQVKTICERYSTLHQFAINFFKLLDSSTQETNLLCVIDSLKRKKFKVNLEQFLVKYAEILTPIAFTSLQEEVKKIEKITITEISSNDKVCKMLIGNHPHTSSASHCICYFRRSWRLPCAHILVVRKEFNLDLFHPELCDSKWLKMSNLYDAELCSPFYGLKISSAVDEITNDQFSSPLPSECNIYSAQEKSLIAKKHCSDIAKIITHSSNSDFNTRCKILKSLKENWSQGISVKLIVEEQNANEHFPGDKINSNTVNKETSSECDSPILPTPIKLKGRSKNDLKTTSGFYCRRRSTSC